MRLRRARADDCEAIWRINNDPEARKHSKQTADIPLAEHEAWYARALADPQATIWIVEHGSVIAGVVRFAREKNAATVSIALSPKQRRRGLGTQALMDACHRYQDENPGVSIEAWIAEGNKASVAAFQKAGFHLKRSQLEAGRLYVIYAY